MTLSPNARWGLIGVVGVIVFAALQFFAQTKNPSSVPQPSDEKARLVELCAEARNEEPQVMQFVYKIDGGYMVYVEPTWYGLKIDEKQAVAAYVARCKLAGSARFLDSRTGKLVARWGSNGYVNYQE